MMTIILAIEPSSDASPFEVLDTFGPTYWTDPERKAVTLGQRWLAVTRDDGTDDYEPGALARVRERLPDPSFYVVESNSEELVAEFVKRVARASRGLVDNDHGWIGWLDEYVGAIEAGLPWLYLKEAPTAS